MENLFMYTVVVLLLGFINVGLCLECYVGKDPGLEMALHDTMSGAIQSHFEGLPGAAEATEDLIDKHFEGGANKLLENDAVFKTCGKIVETIGGETVVIRTGILEDLGLNMCFTKLGVETCLCQTDGCNTAATSGAVLLPLLILPLLVIKLL